MAPVGAFGAMAFTIGKYGAGTIVTLSYFMLTFYATCLLLVFAGLGIVAWLAGFNIVKLVRYLREELLLVLGLYTASFLAIIESVHVKALRLPAQSPNAYSERRVRSAKEECLSKLILFGERSLRRAMREYVVHYHAERNHQGKSNVLLFPEVMETRCHKAVECRERLGGVMRYYHRDAA